MKRMILFLSVAFLLSLGGIQARLSGPTMPPPVDEVR